MGWLFCLPNLSVRTRYECGYRKDAMQIIVCDCHATLTAMTNYFCALIISFANSSVRANS
jgi:hypothetical protein